MAALTYVRDRIEFDDGLRKELQEEMNFREIPKGTPVCLLARRSCTPLSTLSRSLDIPWSWSRIPTTVMVAPSTPPLINCFQRLMERPRKVPLRAVMVVMAPARRPSRWSPRKS